MQIQFRQAPLTLAIFFEIQFDRTDLISCRFNLSILFEIQFDRA